MSLTLGPRQSYEALLAASLREVQAPRAFDSQAISALVADEDDRPTVRSVDSWARSEGRGRRA